MKNAAAVRVLTSVGLSLLVVPFAALTTAVSALAQSGDVVVNANATWASGSYQLNSLTVNNGATLTVGGGSSIVVTNTVTVTADSMIILESNNNSAQVNGAWAGAGVSISAASVEVDSGSSINADGQGYVPNAGPGTTATGSPGASYGGVGGVGSNSSNPVGTYGSATNPTDLGSGGGTLPSDSRDVGGPGGGAIQLNITGTLTNNGIISANGGSSQRYGGGGSGGSVWVTTASLAGAGAIEANGGAGWGGGGGGRVAVYYNGPSSTFTGFAASTASGLVGQVPGTNGTAAFFDTSAANNNLVIYQNFAFAAGTNASYNSLTVEAGATLSIGGGSTITVANALKVTGTVVALSANNTAQVSAAWQGAGVTINAGSVEVDSTGSINADTQGYVPNAGPGVPATGAPGASYGGVGGIGWDSTNPVAAYGSAVAPTDLGSGGGTYPSDPRDVGGNGGGAILLNVTGTLSNNGMISSNGGSSQRYGGGGSGGSVWITANTLAGTGSIAANGGSGWGAGSGGRIAVDYTANNGFNLAQVTANAGSGQNTATNGTVYLLSAGTNLTVLDNTVLPANISLNYTSVTVSGQGSLTLAPSASMTAGSVTVSGGGTFNVGGGSTVNVSGALLVTGNSSVVVQTVNNTAQVNGNWVGAGATIYAGSVEVDAGSSINANYQGYVPNAGPGGTPIGAGGGSYGGVGGVGAGPSNPGPTYGSAATPTLPGSGGGTYPSDPRDLGVPGGGALQLIVPGTLTNNGVISANGASSQRYGGGGSGGSVFLIADQVTGAGTFAANGGNGWGAGGGGRVAVYALAIGGVNPAQLTANGGTSQNAGANGSVVFSNTPQFQWVAPSSNVLFGTVNLAWMAGAVDLTSATVDVTVSGPQVLTLGTGLNANSSLSWDTTTVPDGRYQLTLIFHDGNGNQIGEVPRTVVINNSIAWHAGTLTANQEWNASQVQGLSADVIVPSGITLTIDPGAIVKALPGTQIIVESGGTLTAAGGSQPVIFTAFDDSSVGGDSDFSDGQSVATPGEWDGISVQSGGVFNSNSGTEVFYVESTQSGTLPASEAWPADQLFVVTGNIVVPAGETLTIQPGAVVKFGPTGAINVQPGGQLIANGTIAQPIYFTSLNDNTVGTIASGSSGTPAPGDWQSIVINGGTASFNNVQMLYGGGPQSDSGELIGMIETGGGANVTISNSVLSQSFWNAILTGYVNNVGSGGDTVIVTNTVIDGVQDRGIDAWPGSTVNVVNDTFDNNNTGIQGHGGAVTIANTIVSNTVGTQWGGIFQCCGSTVNVSYSDVWTAATGVANYGGMTDPTGTSGNISANPVYVDNANGNYRLNYGSPAIDAANGTVPNYPLTDAFGDPRYNDPLVTTKTGVPDTNGNYPDIGAFEFVQSAPSNINLTVPSVTGPTSAIVGSQVQINWVDANVGSGDAIGPWHDAIYLVENPNTNPVRVLAGEVLVAGGVTLGPGQTYAGTATVTVPGATVSDHRWEVVANDRGEVFVGANSAHDTGISLDSVAIDLSPIAVNGGATTGSFTAQGQSQWYKIDPSAGQTISVNLSLNGSSGSTSPGSVQLFVGEGYVPTPQHYDLQQVEWDSPTASLVISGTVSQTYYVTAYAQSLVTTPAAFSISASTVQPSLTSVTPTQIVTNYVTTTLTFVGGGFAAGDTFQLVGSNNTVLTPTSVFVTNSTQAQVAFTPNGAPAGSYTAQVIENGTTLSLPNAVTLVIPGTPGTFPGQISVNVEAPEEFRAGFPAVVTLDYTNTGSSDVPAPLISLTATGATLSRMPPPCPNGCSPNFAQMYQNVETSGLVLGINNQGPAGVLPGGASGSVQFIATPTGGSVTFTTQVVDPDSPDWLIDYNYEYSSTGGCTDLSDCVVLVSTGLYPDAAAVCAAYTPTYYNAAGFTRTCMQLLAKAGYQVSACSNLNFSQNCPTLDGRNIDQAVANDATALSQMGIYESDGARMMTFELQNDGLDVFNERYHQGAFGYGTSHEFDIYAELTGITPSPVIFYPDGTARSFPTPSPTQADTYLGIPGDYGVLTGASDGSWTITESNGIQYHFNPPIGNSAILQLGYIQDLDGNRITLSYTNGLMTSAVDSAGNTISFVYDSLGHITQSTDAVGRVTTYTYDILNDSVHSTFLTSITNSSGTTNFAWNEGGSHGVGYLDDTCVTTFCEPAIGINTITYPDGTHIYYSYDSVGRLTSQYRDGGAETIDYSYGPQGQMTIADALGNSAQVIPNQYGALAQTIDPLGSVTQMAYDPEQKVTQAQGPLGTSSSLSYDTMGNAALLADPLGNQENLSFTAYSSIQSLTDANGNATQIAYDAHNNPTGVTFPDGSGLQATYNAAGYVTSYINARGHTTTYTYNADNLITAETYANGSQVTYTYDNHDNLLTVTASNGTTSYTYDSADRTTGVTYPNGQWIQYAYNAGGQRTSMTDSTGFAVQYTYDAAGRLTELTNGSGALIVSYTYDAAGQLTKKTLGNGTYTTYAYDAYGNPLHLVNYSASGGVLSEFDYTFDALTRKATENLPSGAWSFAYDADSEITNVTTPSGMLGYTYDPNGNRITAEGMTYESNNLNQYTVAGSNSYRYDADGNLISGGGWTYTYDDDSRLIGMADATDTWTFQYDGLGNRVSTNHNGTVTQYLNDPSGYGNVEAELNGAGQLIAHYTYGLDLTSEIPAAGTPAYYDFDASGNTAQMTNSAGSVVNSYTYLPFGQKLSSTAGVTNPFTYVGQEGVIDEGNGLYFMRNRWYSPALGRFMQEDPTGLAGGDFNLYRYAANQPSNLFDATGLYTWWNPFTWLDIDTTGYNSSREVARTVDYGLGTYSQSLVQRQQQMDNTVAAVKDQAVETGVMLAAPAVGLEVEATENPVFNEGINHWGVHKLVEGAFKNVSGMAEPEKPGEEGESNGNHGPEHPGPEGEPGPAPSKPSKSYVGPWLKDMANFFSGGLFYKPYGQITVPAADSIDPNGKLTSGFGDQGIIPPNSPIVYTIYFENQPTATAPAVEVSVTDPLPTNLDWSTVQFSQVQFNNVTINVSGSSQTYTGQVSVSTDPNPVNVNASFNSSTGVLTWTMQSVDPTTGTLPANPLAGFLPPNTSGNQGTGYVTFSVMPKAGLPDETTIVNQGSIVFDANAAIATNSVTNTIDSVYPTSTVGALPATSPAASFPVTWSGTDPSGAGIASYTIFVSINGGPYNIWLASTTATSGNYPGIGGQTYSFYSMATDNVGNSQQTPGQIQTTTVTSSLLTPTVAVQPASGNILPAQPLGVTITVSGGGTNATPTGSFILSSGAYSSIVTPLVSGTATITIPAGSLALGTDSLLATYIPDTTSSATYSSAAGSNTVFVGSTAQVAVPNVVGLTQAAATTAITNAGLTVGTVIAQASATVPAGSVISESPAAATQVTTGSVVNLFVSSGTTQDVVPNVVGLTQAAATTAITNAGLTVGTVTTQASSTVPSGTVISESPAGSTPVNAGSAVSLVVSSGTPQVAVPNVVGLSQAAATTALTNAGLTVGTVTTQASSTVPSGTVISESPAAATQVNTGSPVSLVVSSGATSATITLGGLAQTYTGSPLAATATTSPSGLAVAFIYAGTSGAAYGYGPTATPPTNAGSYTVTATITSANYSGSATGTLVIAGAATSISLTSNFNPVFQLDPVTFTATVTSGAGTPTGTVTFLSGTTVLGQANLTGGVAIYTTTSLALGSQSITATYAGGSNFATSTTTPLTQVVENLTFTLPSSTATASPGGSAVFTFTASPGNGLTFPSAVTFTATGLPSGATYTFSPPSLAAGSGSTTVTFTVQVPQTAASVQPASPPSGTQLAHGHHPTAEGLASRATPLMLALLLLPFAGGMRRTGKRFGRILSMLLLITAGIAAIGGITGCGGSSSNQGSQPQSYTITVTGTSGAFVQSATFTLNVE